MRTRQVSGKLPRRNRGQAMVEYALLLVFIALACMTILSLTGNNLSKFFTGFGQRINSLPSIAP